MKITLAVLALVAVVAAAPVAAQTTEQGMAPGTDLTISGVVVSQTGEQLVIRTIAGEKQIRLTGVTNRPVTVAADSRVTVTYREENGQWVASNIAIEAPPPPAPATVVVTSQAPAPPQSPPATTSSDTDRATESTTLPATAGKAPAIALLGGLAIGAALLLRRIS